MKSNKKPNFRNEALKHISQIIREDVLPKLVQGDINHAIIENPIQDVFGTGLNIIITTEIKVEPITEHEFKDKEKQKRQANQSGKNYRGIH